jgi:hypothetical protein
MTVWEPPPCGRPDETFQGQAHLPLLPCYSSGSVSVKSFDPAAELLEHPLDVVISPVDMVNA